MKSEVFESYRRAGKIAKESRELGISLAKEGAVVLDLVEEAEELIRKRGAKPAFPMNVAIDSVAAHYTPRSDDRLRLERGNVVCLLADGGWKYLSTNLWTKELSEDEMAGKIWW